MTQPSFRDVERLSAYLDGQLPPADAARLESRLRADPELASVMKNLREARSILRQLPARKASRSFTLTPKMVGRKPPMPRAYPLLRLASAAALLLLFCTFALNAVTLAPGAAAPQAIYDGIGGGEPDAAATEAPLQPEALQAPALAATAEATPSVTVTEPPTAQRFAPTPPPEEKAAPVEGAEEALPAQPLSRAPFLSPFQTALGLLALICGAAALLLRRAAFQKWRKMK